MSNLPTIRVTGANVLPDNGQWTNRFEIHSETSGNVYVIAQNINKRHWACSCPGYVRYRKCKHLNALNLPCFEKPYEAVIQS